MRKRAIPPCATCMLLPVIALRLGLVAGPAVAAPAPATHDRAAPATSVSLSVPAAAPARRPDGPPTAAACSSAEDCGLLGECSGAGECVCDVGYVGAHCETLDLAPAPADAGLRQRNSSNWCPTILRDGLQRRPARPTCGTCTAATSPAAVWTFGSPARGSSTRRRAGPPRGRTDRRARLRCRRRRTTRKRCGRPMGSTCCWTATPGPMRAARVGSTTVRAP